MAGNAPTIAGSILVAAIATPARANRQSGPGQKWRPCSGDKEDFIRVGTLDLGSGRKTAHVDVAGVRGVRAGHESCFSWHLAFRRECLAPGLWRPLSRGWALARYLAAWASIRQRELVSAWAARRQTGSGWIESLDSQNDSGRAPDKRCFRSRFDRLQARPKVRWRSRSRAKSSLGDSFTKNAPLEAKLQCKSCSRRHRGIAPTGSES